MQLSMCDAGTFKVKKNTTNNNMGIAHLTAIAHYVQRYGLLRYMDDRVTVAVADSFVIIPHPNIYVKRFSKVFLIFLRNFL